MDLSIIIVSYNTEKETLACLSSIFNSIIRFSYEVIVVDNNSSDKTVEKITLLYPQVKLISCDKNYGLSKGNNIGIENSTGNHVFLLNSDTIVFENSIESLLRECIEKKYDIVGPILLNDDQTLQRSWFNFPSHIKILFRVINFYTFFYKISNILNLFLFFLKNKPAFLQGKFQIDTEVDYLSFAATLIKREVIEKIGKLDEKLIFYHEDCEYGLRAKRNNYKIIYCISSSLIHIGGSSSSGFSIFSFENDIKGLLHIYKKHYKLYYLKGIKVVLYFALSWRIFFWRFGFYNNLKKIGIYNEVQIVNKKEINRNLYKKYIELRKYVLEFS